MVRAKHVIATRCELSANSEKLDFIYLMPFLVYKPHVSTTHPPAHEAELNSLRILSAVNGTWDQRQILELQTVRTGISLGSCRQPLFSAFNSSLAC